MLTINNIEVLFKGVIWVLKGVSLNVGAKKIVALLGANGAGKTTTLKAISGLLETEEGRVSHGFIEFNGVAIENRNPEYTAKLGIIQVLEGRKIFEHLTVEENLKIGGWMNPQALVKKDLGMVYDYFPPLKGRAQQTSGYLSGGEMQMMVLGRALMAHPKLMLLDEPSLGLSPLLVKEIFDIIRIINVEEGTAMLLVEQNAKAALSLAEYGYVLENGKVVLDGTAVKLAANEDIKEFYLGLSQVGEKRSYRDLKHYKRRKRWL